MISSLVVECAADAVDAVAAALAEQAGVEVHERKGYKLVVTIEADTVDASSDTARSFVRDSGVCWG